MLSSTALVSSATINQMNLLDQAVKMAAEADEPVSMNYVRKHALQQAEEMGINLRQAATRVSPMPLVPTLLISTWQ